VKPRTQQATHHVQQALVALAPEDLLAVLQRALEAVGGSHDALDFEDTLRFALGWTIETSSGSRYDHWPECVKADEEFEDWIAPDPRVLSERLASLDLSTFYHQILPVFSEWPDLDADPPGTCSNGYRWMHALAQSITDGAWKSPAVEAFQHVPAESPRLTTAELAAGQAIPLGECGDAWGLTAIGDPVDCIDHRPYTDQSRTPLGRCTDAPVLVLYPERGAVDWPRLLAPQSLRAGILLSGASVWILYVTESDAERLHHTPSLTLFDLRDLASRDPQGFAQCRAAAPRDLHDPPDPRIRCKAHDPLAKARGSPVNATISMTVAVGSRPSPSDPWASARDV